MAAQPSAPATENPSVQSLAGSQVPAPMPVLYRSVTALDRTKHRALRLKRIDQPLRHAVHVHILPALIEEFAVAARHLPIVFLPGPDHPQPVFLLGTAPGRNAFISPDGARWTVPYAPAYLRRYPFILGERAGMDPLLMFDDAFEAFSAEEGERLLDEEGQPTEVLQGMIRLCEEYRGSAQRTAAAMRRLQALGLFRPITVDVKAPDAAQGETLKGLVIIDEAKLRTLPDADYLSLRDGGILPALFGHLLSLSAIATLADAGTPTTPPTA